MEIPCLLGVSKSGDSAYTVLCRTDIGISQIAERRNDMLQDMTVPASPQGVFPSQMSLAMAYVPYQSWEEPMRAGDALRAGTVFPSLVKPFCMGKGGADDGRDAAAVFGFDGKG